MVRVYSVVFEGVAVSAVQDLFNLQPATNKPCIIHEVHIMQDAGEVSEQLPVRIRRLPATVTNGTGGSTPTPRQMVSSDPAAGATVRANDATTRATSSGTAVTLRRASDNVLNGWHWVFTPECRPIFIAGEAMIVGLETAPAASLTMSGEVVFEEIA